MEQIKILKQIIKIEKESEGKTTITLDYVEYLKKMLRLNEKIEEITKKYREALNKRKGEKNGNTKN